MCGRFSVAVNPEVLVERFEVSLPDETLFPRYNAAPTQKLPVITNEDDRKIKLFRWGLIPSWAKDLSIGNKLINARAETLSEKPSFRKALEKRRCLVPADGFYEWQKTAQGKIPLRFTLRSEEPFAFAGLWEQWTSSTGEMIPSFTIITTTANELVTPIHNRMPVILRRENEHAWLNNASGVKSWISLLVPYVAGEMKCYPVSPRINSPGFDDPSVLEPDTSVGKDKDSFPTQQTHS